jgi:hypothetical protein
VAQLNQASHLTRHGSLYTALKFLS